MRAIAADDALARWQAEMAARRGLWCLRPDAGREGGGLLTCTILLALTSGVLEWADEDDPRRECFETAEMRTLAVRVERARA